MLMRSYADAVPKGDMSSMEHPIFSLSAKPDMRPRRYERNDNWIETNLRQGGKEYFKVFGLIDSAEIVRETRDRRMLDVEITLSEWVFDAIENHHVLTLNRRYFFLRKPLERTQAEWRIGLGKLRDKCGSGSTVKELRCLIGSTKPDPGLRGLVRFPFALTPAAAKYRDWQDGPMHRHRYFCSNAIAMFAHWSSKLDL